MATFGKVDSFVAAIANKVHNLSSDTLTIALTNTAHNAAWTQLSDLTEIAYTDLSSRVMTTTSSTQTSGTYSYIAEDLQLDATGAIPTFRYIYIYNETATNDELVGYYDYGSAVDLTSGDAFTINFDNVTGVLTLA